MQKEHLNRGFLLECAYTGRERGTKRQMRMKWSFPLILILLCPASFSLAQGDPFAEPSFDGAGVYRYEESYPKARSEKKKKEKKKKVRVPSYTKYKARVKALCAEIGVDGRLEWLEGAIAKAYSDRNFPEDCHACKQFFRSLSLYCKVPEERAPRRKKKPKKSKDAKESETQRSEESLPEDVEPTVAVVYKQREPRLVVLDLATRLFQDIYDDSKNRDITGEAVRFLMGVLRNPEGKSQAELEYFDMLATYSEASFVRYWKRKAEIEEQHRLEKEQQKREFMLETGVGF